MKLILQHPVFGNLKKSTITFACSRCWQLSFSTATIHEDRHSFSSRLKKKSSSEMVDYLITSCGLPLEEATSLSGKLQSWSSVRKAEKVIDFLKESGFASTHIRKIIASCPQLLSARVEKTLMPKVRAFQEIGLSGPLLAHVIACNPIILSISLSKKIVPIIGFFTSSLRDEENVVKAIRRFCSRFFSSTDVINRMAINLQNLKSRGVSDLSLSRLLVTRPTLFALKPDTVTEMVNRVCDLGFSYSSRMFHRALYAVSAMRKSTWDAKLDILKTNGWNQDNIILAIHKDPFFLDLSGINLQKKLQFFMNVRKFKPSELALAPCIMMFSMEKRVIPRLSVIDMLDSEKIPRRARNLLTVLQMKEELFYEEYVLKHKDKCPNLLQAYRRSIKGNSDAGITC